jgi:hypothetical protein
MFEHVMFFSSVVPGPACRIPEDKQIFRVTQAEAPVDFTDRSSLLLDCDGAAEGARETLQFPVPHMYSA